jgi:hypothetical protein
MWYGTGQPTSTASFRINYGRGKIVVTTRTFGYGPDGANPVMATTATPPRLDVLDVDGGVIEDARARQRHQRGIATAAVMAAIATAVLALVLGGGGGEPEADRHQHTQPPSSGRGVVGLNGRSPAGQSISSVGVSLTSKRR